MSLLKTNEIQNYNGSSLTLTASTVSTSAQLNTGGNISVTGSLNVSDDSTTRTNLGLGTIATQDSDSITVTGGSVTGTEIDLKSSGTTIFQSDGTTAVLSESGGVVTLNNGTIGSSVMFPAGHILQVQSGTYSTQTSIGTTITYVIDLEFQTIGANSKFIAFANACVGNYADNEGYEGGISLSSGTTPSNTDFMEQSAATNASTRNALFIDDIGDSRDNSLSIRFVNWSAEKTTSFGQGTTITVALWFIGQSTMYINRSNSRASHESGITKLTVFEIAT